MEIKREVIFGNSLESELKRGIDILAAAVKSTMGPKGKLVLIQREGSHPIVTKDGVTVAQSINLSNKIQNLGVKVIKEAAARTAEEAGDGTTTSTVLAQKIFNEGLKMKSAGFQVDLIKAGIEKGLEAIISCLSEQRKIITSDDELQQVAVISANGEQEIANLIVSAIKSSGVDGSIIVEEAKGFKSDLIVVDGYKLERGYLSPYFVTDKNKMTSEFDNPLILLANREFSSIRDLMKPLEMALESSRPILVIANDIDGEALKGLVLNKVKGSLRISAIKSPGFGSSRHELLNDLQALVGGTVIGTSFKMEDFKFEDFGTCKKVLSQKNSTMIIDEASEDNEDIMQRVQSIKQRLKDPSVDKQEMQLLKYRLQQLSGGISILRVGAATESELIERYDRVDDALNATRAALEEGILPGGGVALLKAQKTINAKMALEDNPDVRAGLQVMSRACVEPFKQIIRNGPKSPDNLLSKVMESPDSVGYDARNNKLGNMFDVGIVDPNKVVRCAIENAVSAASMLLSAGCCLIEIDQKQGSEDDTYV